MYYIYKITNVISGKIYIGLTKDIKKRWKMHINESKNKSANSYGYPLKRDIRKYGPENFNIDILHSCIKTKKEGLILEKQEIIKNNSFIEGGYGYNKNFSDLHCLKCAEVDCNGNIIMIFKSVVEASEYYNNGEKYGKSAISSVCNGNSITYKGKYFRHLDESNNIIDKKYKENIQNTKVCCINVFDLCDIKIYNSITELLKDIKSNRKSVHGCINGESRYSVVKLKIIRKIDNNNNIIENEINIKKIHEKYINKLKSNKYFPYKKKYEEMGLVPRV